jgi:hypothetical protein
MQGDKQYYTLHTKEHNAFYRFPSQIKLYIFFQSIVHKIHIV